MFSNINEIRNTHESTDIKLIAAQFLPFSKVLVGFKISISLHAKVQFESLCNISKFKFADVANIFEV